MPWSKDAQESRSPAEETGGRTLSRRSHSPGSPTDPHLLHYEREIISLDDRGPLSRRKLGKDTQNFMLQLRKLDLRFDRGSPIQQGFHVLCLAIQRCQPSRASNGIERSIDNAAHERGFKGIRFIELVDALIDAQEEILDNILCNCLVMGDQKGGPRRLELLALHQRFQTIPVTAFEARMACRSSMAPSLSL
jgi:hypothetical protein